MTLLGLPPLSISGHMDRLPCLVVYLAASQRVIESKTKTRVTGIVVVLWACGTILFDSSTWWLLLLLLDGGGYKVY